MWEALRGFLGSLVGPAIVATLVSFYLTTRDERRRTLRDRITAGFEETRNDVRAAVLAGVAYFGGADAAKLRDLEAQVLLYESDVRSGMAAIRELCSEEDLTCVPTLLVVEGEFLDALTGGQFGSPRPAADRERTRRIIGLGSRLRGDLSRLRRHQLSSAMTTASRLTGLFILFLVTVAIIYGAGLYAGILIESSPASNVPCPAKSVTTANCAPAH